MRPKAGRRHFWGVHQKLCDRSNPQPSYFFRPWFNTVMLVWKMDFSRKQVHEVHSSLIEQLRSLSILIKHSTNRPSDANPFNQAQATVIESEINDLIDQIEEKPYLLLSFTLQSRYHAQPHSLVTL